MPDGAPEEKGTDAGPEPKEGEHFGTFGRPTGADFSYNGEQGTARRHFFRDRENKAIGGVCAGMGALFNIDVTIIRIIFLVCIFGGGFGLLVYLILWMVVPSAKTSADFCQMHGLEPTAENMAKFTIKREK
jgi:phage shock protein PspC (stress-responsive transcriptional regulator)